MVKNLIINRISNFTFDFTLDKTFFSNDIAKGYLHDFGLNVRHMGLILNRLE